MPRSLTRVHFLPQLICLVAILVCASRPCIAEQPGIMLDGMWLGATIEDLRSLGFVENVGKSKLLKDANSTYAGRSSAHFSNGEAQILGGTVLSQDNTVLMREGDTRKQTLSKAHELGWKVDGEWESASDVAQHHNRVLRLQLPNRVSALVVFFRSDFAPAEPEAISEIYLRTENVRGPYGDENY